jgi:DNA-binding SARP family transcriptional activator
VEFRLLGPLAVIFNGQEVGLGGPRERTVLAVLLLERGRIVPFDRLVDALWDDSPPESARGQIHICISTLRQRLAAAGERGVIETRRPGYLLRVSEGQCDLDEFIRLTAEGRGHAAANRHEQAAERLRAALDLWRGMPLADIDSGLVQGAALGLAEQRVSANEDWLDACLAQGRHEEVCREAGLLVAEFPLRERLRRQQVTALYRAGRVADALGAYRQARDAFIDELGLEPSPRFQWLERAVLTHDAALGVPGTDPQGQAMIPVVPRQLPPGIGDFTGREGPIAQLRAEVRPGGTGPRVVVVTGPAGVGKTALAVHVAHLVEDAFPDGQLFAELHGGGARPTATSWVLERFLRALGLSGTAIPDAAEDRKMLYRSLASGRRLLVVLDDAAAEEQVRELLPGAAGCAAIVTSRRRLTGLGGARHVEVALLSADDATRLLATLTGYPVETADPEVRSLVRLCAGLPLALRIAASRLAARPHWTVTDLVARLDGERSRLDELVHGEMGVRPSISLSYDGLEPGARRLFRLAGLLDVDDFPAWVGAPLLDTDPPAARELLEQLVDARLVEVTGREEDGQLRYRVHDLLRIYARERLAAEEPAAERRDALARFLGCVLYLTEEAHRREYGGDHTVLHGPADRFRLGVGTVAGLLGQPLRWLERERPTIVAAVRQAARAGLAAYAWDLAISAVSLFELGTFFGDWLETHEVALAAARQAGDRLGEATMEYSLGALFIAQQQLAEAAVHLKSAGRIFEELGNPYGEALVRRNNGFIQRTLGQLGKASEEYMAALDLFRVASDPVAEAHVLSGMTLIHIERGEFAAAEEVMERAVRLCRGMSQRMLAQLTYRSGELCLARGDLPGAAARFEAVLAAAGKFHDEVGATYARWGLGVVALGQDQLVAAESHLGAGLTLASRIGERMVQGRLLLALGQAHARSARVAAASAALTRALEMFTAQGAVLWRARALDALATLHADTGDPTGARSLSREAMALLRGLPLADAAHIAGQLSARLAD